MATRRSPPPTSRSSSRAPRCSNGTFNEFTGNGGNDTIIGNGNTRLNFNNATAGQAITLDGGQMLRTGTG